MQWRDIHRSRVVVTPPTVEVFGRTEAKLQLQIDATDDDALIDGLIRAARRRVESDTNRVLTSTVYDLWCDAFPGERAISLGVAPVSAVASITSYDDANAATVMTASDYFVDTKSEPGRVVLIDAGSWPSDLRPANGGVIRFTAGYTGTAVSVSSVSRSGTTATVTTGAAHGFLKGQRITIAGADQDDYNGTHAITVTSTTGFTFVVTGSPTTPATGTITATDLGIPDSYFQAMALWMSHLYRPDPRVDDLVERVYGSLTADRVAAFG